jgi:alkaline phosphatase D
MLPMRSHSTDTDPSGTLSEGGTLRRRDFLRGSLAAGAGFAAGAAGLGGARAFAFVPDRPVITHGVQSGDVGARSAVVWARADRPSLMLVEVSTTPSFRRSSIVEGPVLTPDSDFTGRVRLRGLRPGQEVFYRVSLEDLDNPFVSSRPVDGSLRTASRRHGQDVSFVWGGDVAGQGYGINPDFGGYRIFRAMEAVEPDFFLCSGDLIYADGPIHETVALPDGRVWRNLTTEAKSKVADTLAEFRGQYAYNLIDENLRRFASRVPQINQWDDHEVLNNWYPGEILPESDPQAEKRVDVLAARAKQAFFEWVPITPGAERAQRIYRKLERGPLLDVFILDMRTYKDPNDDNRYADPARGLLGAEQREWLKRELVASRATWKVIANDLPLGLLVPDGPGIWEGVAQGDPGPPLGRELEFAEVLTHAHRNGVTGIVMLTADVHYAAAHHYSPDRAPGQEFTPFWEFVAGPLNAGGFGPNELDATFGPEAVFVAPPPRVLASPLEGSQFFGEVKIDGGSERMTVNLRDVDGRLLHREELDPEGP